MVTCPGRQKILATPLVASSYLGLNVMCSDRLAVVVSFPAEVLR